MRRRDDSEDIFKRISKDIFERILRISVPFGPDEFLKIPVEKKSDLENEKENTWLNSIQYSH